MSALPSRARDNASLASRPCWFFDLDDTLVASGQWHERAFRTALEDCLPSVPPAFTYAALAGRSTHEVIAALGVHDAEAIARIARRKQQLYRRSVADGSVQPVPGCVDLLRDLVARGRSLYLVTAGSHGSASAALRACGLEDFFAGRVTGDDVTRTKPAPDIYLAARRSFCDDADAVVVVEDSIAGIRAARAAGLTAIHVGAGSTVDDAPSLPTLRALHQAIDGVRA